MMMRGKLHRFIFVESRFEPTFMIFFILVLISGLQIAGVYYLNGRIKEAESRRTLIELTPMMETVLYPKWSRPAITDSAFSETLEINNASYTLNGIQQLNGRPAALINSDIYQEGDHIAGYRIAKITVNSVLLKHIQSGEMKLLRLGN